MLFIPTKQVVPADLDERAKHVDGVTENVDVGVAGVFLDSNRQNGNRKVHFFGEKE